MGRRLLAFLIAIAGGLTLLLTHGAYAQCVRGPACTIIEPPPVETVTADKTITANACGTVKRVTAASPVTTNTTNTFATGHLGCWMTVCNLGSTITLDNNARFKTVGGADVALGLDDCVSVVSTGSAWRQMSPLSANQ